MVPESRILAIKNWFMHVISIRMPWLPPNCPESREMHQKIVWESGGWVRGIRKLKQTPISLKPHRRHSCHIHGIWNRPLENYNFIFAVILFDRFPATSQGLLSLIGAARIQSNNIQYNGVTISQIKNLPAPLALQSGAPPQYRLFVWPHFAGLGTPRGRGQTKASKYIQHHDSCAKQVINFQNSSNNASIEWALYSRISRHQPGDPKYLRYLAYVNSSHWPHISGLLVVRLGT